MSPGDYAAVATARAKEIRVRIASGAFVAVAAWVFTGGPWGWVWFAAMVGYQYVDLWISRPIRRHPAVEPSAPMRAVYATSIAFSAVLFSAVAFYIWFAGGVAGKAFALLMPAGAVLAMSVRIGSARRVFMAGWLPHAIILVAIPLVAALVSPRDHVVELVCLAVGGVMYLVQVAVAVSRIERGSRALRSARDEAETSRVAAERASAAKSDFLATISHEIRTPMNAVVAAADLLRRTPLSAEQTEHVDILSNATEVLLGLLNDVLDLSKIEAGKLEREFAEFDLVQKLTLGVQLWRPRAALKGVELVFNANDLPARIVTDPLRLQQIVFNLLSNAVKFTDAGRIELRGGLSADRATLWFEVEDTGCGMDEEACSRVFASFEQATGQTARQYGGTGLGLAISRRLAELLDGSLTVTSEKGRGSVFRLETPFVGVEDSVLPDAPEAAAAQGSAEGLEVLVAEDHPVNQRIVTLILEPLGCRLTIAGDGAQAVEQAALRPFDVILMDMQMPVLDGLQATHEIRHGGGPNKDTPIIALTANVMAEHRAQWAAVGVHRFASKPVDMQALIDVVVEAGSERRACRQAQGAAAA